MKRLLVAMVTMVMLMCGGIVMASLAKPTHDCTLVQDVDGSWRNLCLIEDPDPTASEIHPYLILPTIEGECSQILNAKGEKVCLINGVYTIIDNPDPVEFRIVDPCRRVCTVFDDECIDCLRIHTITDDINPQVTRAGTACRRACSQLDWVCLERCDNEAYEACTNPSECLSEGRTGCSDYGGTVTAVLFMPLNELDQRCAVQCSVTGTGEVFTIRISCPPEIVSPIPPPDDDDVALPYGAP